MSSIHGLSAIINDLENRLSKYKKDSPSDKEIAITNRQVKLIGQLTEIYKAHENMTLYDMFVEIQKEYDKLRVKDPDIDGLYIKLPLKDNAKRYGLIEYTL